MNVAIMVVRMLESFMFVCSVVFSDVLYVIAMNEVSMFLNK